MRLARCCGSWDDIKMVNLSATAQTKRVWQTQCDATWRLAMHGADVLEWSQRPVCECATTTRRQSDSWLLQMRARRPAGRTDARRHHLMTCDQCPQNLSCCCCCFTTFDCTDGDDRRACLLDESGTQPSCCHRVHCEFTARPLLHPRPPELAQSRERGYLTITACRQPCVRRQLATLR